MPQYRFFCKKCQKEEVRVVPLSWDFVPCSCGGAMEKQLPILKKVVTKEKVDVSRNIDWIDDQEKILEDRSREHFWKVEVPRLVQSGEYSIKTMMENGWIYIDENGNQKMRTTPPNTEQAIEITPKQKK
jgi:hypothetical protein